MQANDIKTGKTYAIIHNEKPVRFHVDQVNVTKQRTYTKTSYESEAYGHISPNDWDGELPEDMQERTKILGRWVAVDQVLGPYDEYIELKEKAEAETKATKDAKELAIQNADQLVEILYLLVNTARPDKEERRKSSTKQLFEDRYGYGEVSIDPKGVAALLPVLRELMKTVDK